MDKRLIYAAFWSDNLQELVDFLVLNNYSDTETINHLDYLLKDQKSASKRVA